MIRKIDHIGIAVERIDEQIPFYRDVLGLSYEGTEVLADRGLKVAFFRIGEVSLELLEPVDDRSAVASFIRKKGPGIHHIAFRSDDIHQDIEKVRSSGLRMIDDEPKPGAHGSRVAFIHPKTTFRVLMELVSRAEDG